MVCKVIVEILMSQNVKNSTVIFFSSRRRHTISKRDWSSDVCSSDLVKYHQGFSSDIKTGGGTVHLTLAFNPSHLEIVNPVVEGSVRARQHRRGDHTGEAVLPLLIHGDAAFAGQGVVMET